MKTRDFHYELPASLIAQTPAEQRSASRLLKLDRAQDEISHHHFTDLPDFLQAGDLLVFNDTRVIPARLYGTKSTGGKVEILIERMLDEHRCVAHVRASKSPRAGARINIEGSGHALTVVGRQQDLFELRSDANIALSQLMQQAGHMPLPPYITRADETMDYERYQTVYAKQPGAVAAPTAGLHFDDTLLERLRQRGVEFCYVTLHVGAGTFQPVRVDNIIDHVMHAEYIDVNEATVAACQRARARGGRIIAVGTTSVRSLETAAASGELKPYRGDTDIFITPGYQFNSVDALITNFHLPESTLMMLVSAFASREQILRSYQAAIDQHYRFFSYGDAMLIE